MDKQELDQEINKLKTNSEINKSNPTSYTPWIIGGAVIILFILAGLGVVKIRSRRRYYYRRRRRF